MGAEWTRNGSAGLYISVVVVIAYGSLFWGFLIRRRLAQSLNCLPIRGRLHPRGLSFLYWGSPVLFLAVWGIASYSGFAPSRIIPTPVEVGWSFWNLTTDGTLPTEAFISFKRVMIGFALGSAVGVPLGFAAGSFLAGRHLIEPVNSFLRYIPPTAFISLLIVYFGVGEGFKYAVVFLGVIFFIVQMVIDVVDDVDVRFVEIALTSGESNWQVFRRVVIPFCWPRVFDVLRINLSAAWTFLVAAELIGAERGLGHFIAVSQRFLRMSDLYAGILTFGIIGLATDRVLELTSHRIFRWYYVALRQ